MKQNIALIVLTYNEEKNLPYCLKSVSGLVYEVFVVDSYSTDDTEKVAKRFGARFVQHEFVSQAQQFNWALDNLEIKSDWILRLDADEWITDALKEEILEVLDVGDNKIVGYSMRRRLYFMGRWIKHGGYYPIWLVRLFRKGRGRSEYRKMDEHIIVDGLVKKLSNDFVDENHKGLSFWIEKHNEYATREAGQILEQTTNSKLQIEETKMLDEETRRKREKKELYYKLPMFLRAALYWKYRYFFRLGFLDGVQGLIFHFLQGFWYRFLVDSKIYENMCKK